MRTGFRRVQCYAHGKPGNWEAICVDLDIAVQGTSFDEVQTILNEAIAGYIKDALAEDERHARALLTRRAPFHLRLKLALAYVAHTIRRDGDGEFKAGFDVPCPA